MRHEHARSLRVAVVLLLSACYRYVPIASAGLPPGADVRLTLTPAGATTLLPILGRGTTAVEGHMLSASDSGFRLAVSGTLKPNEDSGGELTRTVWAGESVLIPRSAVGTVEQRSLNSRRTAFAVGLGTIAAALAVKLIVHVVGSSGGDSNGGGTVVTP